MPYIILRCFWIGCDFSKFWLESNESVLLIFLWKNEKCKHFLTNAMTLSFHSNFTSTYKFNLRKWFKVWEDFRDVFF